MSRMRIPPVFRKIADLFYRSTTDRRFSFGLDDIQHLASVDWAEAQRLLVEEQRRLAKEFTRLNALFESRLADTASRLGQAREAMDAAEIQAVREEQMRIASALRRLEIAEKETQELKDEWAEWRVAGRILADERAITPAQKEREEMLRSELSARGIRLSGYVESGVASPMASETREPMVQTETRAIPKSSPEDAYLAWEEIFGDATAQSVTYWNETLQAVLAHKQVDPKQAAEAARRLREASGLRRRRTLFLLL